MLNTSTDIMLLFVLVSLAILGFLFIINQPKDSPNRIVNLVLVAVLALLPVVIGGVKVLSGIQFPASAPTGITANAKYDAEKSSLITDVTNITPILRVIASVGEDRYNEIAGDPDSYDAYKNRSQYYLNTISALAKKYETNSFETKVRDKVSDLTLLLKESLNAARNFKGVFADENGAEFGTYQTPASKALGYVTTITNGL